MAPVPPASSKASGQTRQSRRCRHALHEDARAAPGRPNRGGDRHRGAEHRYRMALAGQERRVLLERAQLLAAQHGDEPRQLRLEAVDRGGLVHAGRLEVQGQGTRGHAQSDPAPVARLQPGDLLGHERRGAQGEQEWCGGGPPRGVLLQDEGGHLQRLRHVAGEPAVVLAGHDAVEAMRQGERCLSAQLVDDGVGGELVVRVEPNGNRPRGERSGRGCGRRVRHGVPIFSGWSPPRG